MSKYRKRPVEVDAWQWLGQPPSEWPDWIDQDIQIEGHTEYLYIHTLKGVVRADLGEWIVRVIKNELYPVKPDIFEQTYIRSEGVKDAKFIDALATCIREAKRFYYAGHPIINDYQYDALEALMMRLDKNNPVLSEVGTDG